MDQLALHKGGLELLPPLMETTWMDVLGWAIAALFGGGATVGVQKSKKMTQQEANDQSTLTFYALWNDELKRLREEIDHLHVLVAALETEIITLGGDPVRVRLELAKMRQQN